MPRLTAVRLCVSDPAELARFYVDHLGMTLSLDDREWRLGYPGEDADLILLPGAPSYQHKSTDRYWKIGVTLPNVDLAFGQLRAAGIQVTQPKQFRDIGYMCHLSDPEGHQIELLQHHFYGNRPVDAGDPAQPLGGGAHIGQITLRTGNIAAERQIAQTHGMTLLSIQPVTDYGFDLYFWAFSSEHPSNPDLHAVENREWLWQRPYTTLEFQHVDGLTPTKNPGFAGLRLGATDMSDFTINRD